MAMLGCGAPVPGSSALVEDPRMQELVQTSQVLLEKVLQAIPEAHRSFVYSESLNLSSSENTKLVIMESTIGIPEAPALNPLSENVTMETCLRQISEGLRLYQALLTVICNRLNNNDRMLSLQADIRDLDIWINKMLKMVGKPVVLPTFKLNLPGDYEVQVAVHLTLLRLQQFGQNVDRYLKSLDHTTDASMDN